MTITTVTPSPTRKDTEIEQKILIQWMSHRIRTPITIHRMGVLTSLYIFIIINIRFKTKQINGTGDLPYGRFIIMKTLKSMNPH